MIQETEKWNVAKRWLPSRGSKTASQQNTGHSQKSRRWTVLVLNEGLSLDAPLVSHGDNSGLPLAFPTKKIDRQRSTPADTGGDIEPSRLLAMAGPRLHGLNPIHDPSCGRPIEYAGFT